MNTAQQEFPAIGSLRQWYQMVEGGAKIRHLVTPMSSAEALQLMEKALTLPAWFAKRGITCRVSGSKDVVKYGFKVAAGGSEFQVNPVHVPFVGKRPQAVTETSREAYHSLDLNAACTEFVKHALKLGETYDRQVAAKMGKEAGYVSARRNDLEKLAEFNYQGQKMQVVYTLKQPCLVTGKTVQWWRIVEAGGQGKLF